MRLRTIVTLLATLLIVAVVGIVALLLSTDLNRYRGLVAERVEAATGRKLTLGGDFELALSLRPTAAVNDVAFANASWGSRPDLARFDRLEVEMELLPLLRGEIAVRRVLLIGADILLETDAEGHGNWMVLGEGEASAATAEPADPRRRLPTVNEIVLERAMLTYRDGATGRLRSLGIDRLRATAETLSSPVGFELEGLVENLPVRLAGSLGAMRLLLDGLAYPVDLQGTLGSTELAVKGELAQPLMAQGLNLALAVQGEQPAELAALAGLALPPLAPYGISGTLSDADGTFRLTGAQLRLGGSDLAGDMALALDGPRPRLEAALTSARLDLADLGLGGGGGGPHPADGRLFPDAPLMLEGLRLADASIRFRGQQVIRGPVALADVAAEIALSEGRLAVSGFSGHLAGGTLSGSALVDAGGPQPFLQTSLAARGVEAGPLLQALSISDVLQGGRADLDLDIRGAGRSVRALMAGLSGSARLGMVGGRIDNGFARLLFADLFRLVASGGGTDSTDLNCIVGRFDVRDGLASSQGLVIDTKGATIVGSGTVQLATEGLDLRFDPVAKQANLANLAVAMRVRGTLAEPRVTPDPASVAANAAGIAAIVATGGLLGVVAGANTLLSGQANPCAAALEKAAAAPPQPSDAAPSSGGRILEGAGEALQDLGQGIRSLFE